MRSAPTQPTSPGPASSPGRMAADRARLLDTLRVAGAPLPLAWDAFLNTVVIETFSADYRSPWWIPYRLSCTVLRDEAAAVVTSALSLAPALAADLLVAGPYASAAATAVTASGATTRGTTAYATASTAVGSTLAGLDGMVATTQTAIQTSDVLAAASACGLLAQLTAGPRLYRPR